ncbi:MAG: hypothetical protein R2932_50450 [Caldilineaceae bacterium]
MCHLRGPDAAYQGRELCFNASVANDRVDVTDKSAPQRLATLTTAGNFYIHQGWLTPDQRYFVFNDEMDEWFGNHHAELHRGCAKIGRRC